MSFATVRVNTTTSISTFFVACVFLLILLPVSAAAALVVVDAVLGDAGQSLDRVLAGSPGLGGWAAPPAQRNQPRPGGRMGVVIEGDPPQEVGLSLRAATDGGRRCRSTKTLKRKSWKLVMIPRLPFAAAERAFSLLCLDSFAGHDAWRSACVSWCCLILRPTMPTGSCCCLLKRFSWPSENLRTSSTAPGLMMAAEERLNDD